MNYRKKGKELCLLMFVIWELFWFLIIPSSAPYKWDDMLILTILGFVIFIIVGLLVVKLTTEPDIKNDIVGMKICPKCNTINKKDNKFCSECGENLLNTHQ